MRIRWNINIISFARLFIISMRKIWKYLVSREAVYRIESPPSSSKWHETVHIITKVRTRKYRKLKIDLTLKRIYRWRVSPQNVNLMTYEKKKLIHYYENITFTFARNANLFIAISRYIGNLFTVFFFLQFLLYNQSTCIHVYIVIWNSNRYKSIRRKCFLFVANTVEYRTYIKLFSTSTWIFCNSNNFNSLRNPWLPSTNQASSFRITLKEKRAFF